MSHAPLSPPARRRGFTLAEVLIASVVVAFVSIALSQAIVIGHQQSYNALDEHRAATVAESTLERVLALPYDDPDGHTSLGPDSGETTAADYDAIDDFHKHTETAGSLVDGTGAALPDAYQDLALSVAIDRQTLSAPALGGDHDGLQITVSVARANGQITTLSRWVGEDGR
ncbi:MAG: prepilin-type N-terminal cleavage/methylation domain-containing protein [Planctomycetota bacterium]